MSAAGAADRVCPIGRKKTGAEELKSRRSTLVKVGRRKVVRFARRLTYPAFLRFTVFGGELVIVGNITELGGDDWTKITGNLLDHPRHTSILHPSSWSFGVETDSNAANHFTRLRVNLTW